MSEGTFGRGMILLYAISAVIVLFLLVPLLFPIALSFSDTPFVVFPPQGFTLEWYGKVLLDQDFTTPFLFSVQLGLLSAAGALLLGTPTAMGLVRYDFPGRGLIQGLVLSPLVFPMLVTGIALLRLFTSLGSHASLVNLAIGHTLVTVPYVIRTVSASLLLIDPSTEDAARTLGASKFTTFWRITRPQIVPGLFAGGIFAFVTSFDNYAVSMWLADAEHFPMPMAMFSLISRMFDPGIAAIASLMILMSIVIVVVLERLTGLQRAMSV
jgi:putative spermidine/putrescine transport system permease protein